MCAHLKHWLGRRFAKLKQIEKAIAQKAVVGPLPLLNIIYTPYVAESTPIPANGKMQKKEKNSNREQPSFEQPERQRNF